MKRALILLIIILMISILPAAARASESGESRRIDTSKVLKAEFSEDEIEEHGTAAVETEEEADEEEHHPVWMFTGWQSVFTVLAVAYFALGIKVLPLFMAKEEEGHH